MSEVKRKDGPRNIKWEVKNLYGSQREVLQFNIGWDFYCKWDIPLFVLKPYFDM